MNELVILNSMLNALEFENNKNSREIVYNITTLIYLLETDGVNVDIYRNRFIKIKFVF